MVRNKRNKNASIWSGSHIS